MLWIGDLIAAYQAACERIDVAAGQIYNMGGGPENSVSVWTEFGPKLESLAAGRVEVTHADPRPGDQLVYISDIGKARRDLAWTPRVSMSEGIERLWEWIDANVDLFLARTG